jgi:hypothetical protein
LITCAALRTNLTIREIAASFAISKSAAHRIVATMTPRLATLGRVLADGGYRGVPALVTPAFRGRRILRDRAWRRHRRRRARVEHAIARLKNWRVLRDHRRRGCHLAAVAFLHHLHLDELRNNL